MTPEQREIAERSEFVWETWKAHAEKGRSSMPIYLDDLAVVLAEAKRRGAENGWDVGYLAAIEASLPRYNPRSKWPNPYRANQIAQGQT